MGAVQVGREAVMRPETLSAAVCAVAISIGVFTVAFNLGHMKASAKARQCSPISMTYAIPFKGTLP